MSTKIKISIVIPNWNGARLLPKNLPKVIAARENPGNRIIEIIIVDDGSTDNSVEIIKRFGDKVRLVQHSVNRGFSHAVNTGARFARGTHLCLLNTDVVPSKDFLAPLIDYLKDPKLFGITLHEEGYGPSTGCFDGYLRHSGGKESNNVQESLWASGGSSVFSKRVWKELKGMDSELFDPFYWEDVDLGFRARKRGYKILWVPEAQVVHAHESVINPSNFRKRYLNLIKERNELLFIWKNITSKRYTKMHRNALFERLKKHPGYIKVVLAALLKIRTVMKRRKREISEAIVSDEVIFEKFC